MERIAKLKWQWVGHVARAAVDRRITRDGDQELVDHPENGLLISRDLIRTNRTAQDRAF